MYELSAILNKHVSDVKASVFCQDKVISVSRDKSVIIWDVNSASVLCEITEHSGFVNSVACLEDCIATGGNDGLILIHTLDGQHLLSMHHEGNVCCLDAVNLSFGVISGSWDCTARVWEDGNQKYLLSGHEQAVWAAKAIDSATFVTGSADKKIKLWSKEKCLKTIEAHEEAVRDIALSKNRIISCSNDGSIKVWTMDLTFVTSLSNTPFVYSICAFEDFIVCSGEDSLAKIYLDYELVQTLEIPSISVWKVSVNQVGDLAFSCSNSKIYIYSTNGKKHESTMQFSLEMQQFQSKQKPKVLDASFLQTQGVKDQVAVVDVDGNHEVHQFDGTKWTKVGDVAREPDYTFTIESGSQTFKLFYNLGENPYQVAKDFVQKHNLNPQDVEEVANFIQQNTPKKQYMLFTQINPDLIFDKLEKLGYQNARTTEAAINSMMDFKLQDRYPIFDLLRQKVLETNIDLKVFEKVLETLKTKNDLNCITGLRVIANMFSKNINLVKQKKQEILLILNDYKTSTNKNARYMIFCVLFNYSFDSCVEVMSLLLEMLKTEKEEQNIYQGLLAVSNSNVKTNVKEIENIKSSDRVAAKVKEILELKFY